MAQSMRTIKPKNSKPKRVIVKVNSLPENLPKNNPNNKINTKGIKRY